MDHNVGREAFDLHNKACRDNFKYHLKRDKFDLWFWKLVLSDTWNRICSKKEK